MYLLILLLGFVFSYDPPEEYRPTPALIRQWGYPAETHYVTTLDGYILALHRIPHGRKPSSSSSTEKPVVLLQHGLEDSSATWVINRPDQSLGFMLADAGCDVWMGNVRGNTYSRNHTSLSTRDTAFWAFTFDEHALFDLPSMIYYVLDFTGAQTLSYYGHSQGTLMGFLGFSSSPELSKKVNLFAALAPVAQITHVEGLIRAINYVEPELQWIIEHLGINELTLPAWLLEMLIDVVCPRAQHKLCENLIFLGTGWDTSNLNATRIPVYAGHTPAGTSTLNIIHWAQLLRARRIQKFDYGSEKANMAHYNTSTPPQYHVEKLEVPVALFAGGNDFLADPRDVIWLEGQLKPGLVVLNRFYDDYNHLDFVWGMDANRRVYDYLVKLVPGL